MKTISVLIPCYNEEENVAQMGAAIVNIFESQMVNYDYEVIFIDNDSKDRTRPLLREMCRNNKKIKAIFNAKNFGQFNSPYYGLLQTSGDCTIFMCCDFQDPVEMIPEMVKQWEAGYKIVVMQKNSSEENKIMYFLRTMYYRIIRKLSQVEQIEHFTGFGLYDKSFIEVMRELKDPIPFLRGIVAELGYKMKIISYTQQKRRAGKTHNNFYSLYDAAMLSFTSYTKMGLRAATFLGFGVALISIFIALYNIVMKLILWDSYDMGIATMSVGLFFVGAVQLIFIGLMGEYIISINQRSMNRPLVIEEERLNFD